MSDDEINVALVGYGLGGATFHAPLIAATPGLRLAAIVTRDAGRRAAAAQRYPGVRLVDEVGALSSIEPAIDLLVISSPSGTHAALARAGLAAGMHVVVDKPFAATAAEAREIATLAVSAGRLAIPFQNRRWDGDFLTLRRLLREGWLGEPLRLESRFERWRPTTKARWREAGARERSEGIVYDIGSHLVDQAIQLFGPVTQVYAELDRRRRDLEVEDDAFLSLVHHRGVRSHLHMSFSAQAAGARFTLVGSKAGYVKHGLDQQESALSAGRDPATSDWLEETAESWGMLHADGVTTSVRTERGRYPDFYRGVARAIAEGAAVPVEVEEVALSLEAIEAAFVSAREGRAVRIDR